MKTVVSSPQMLYKLNEVNFDVIHLNHKPVTKHILRLYQTLNGYDYSF
jgi:hypothetical protein